MSQLIEKMNNVFQFTNDMNGVFRLPDCSIHKNLKSKRSPNSALWGLVRVICMGFFPKWVWVMGYEKVWVMGSNYAVIDLVIPKIYGVWGVMGY